MATLGDVAALAGVSVSAVSRVLSNAPSARVSEATRTRIREAAESLDYRPNFAGRALRLARSRVIALVVPDLNNAIFTNMIRGVEEEALRLDYSVLLGRAESTQMGGEMLQRLVGEGRVDGVLMQVDDHADEQSIRDLVGQVPVVLINSTANGHVGSVEVDDAKGVEVAVQHLRHLGHSKIGFLGGLASSPSAQRRETAFLRLAERDKFICEPSWVTQVGYSPEAGREAATKVLTGQRRPTALVVANVNAALGVLAQARELGVSIPDDISTVAIHDSWVADHTWPPLTTVRMPLYELGRAGLRALVEKLDGEPVGDVVISDPLPELIVRESTRPKSLSSRLRAETPK